jgi:putative acetyltransferase
MTPLRQRLIEKLRLKNYSIRTQQAYVAAVAHFARHFGRSPDQLGADEIHQWQLHLRDVRHCSWSGYNVAMCALRFFYREVLGGRRAGPSAAECSVFDEMLAKFRIVVAHTILLVPMFIREARPSDRQVLLDIWLRSVRATHIFLSEEHIEVLLPLVRDEALPNLELWVLCADDDTPIGFIGLAESHVEALFLAPEWMRRGGGTLLLQHAHRLKGPLEVDVNEQNLPALRFYLARGFDIVGRSAVDTQGDPFPLLHLREH